MKKLFIFLILLSFSNLNSFSCCFSKKQSAQKLYENIVNIHHATDLSKSKKQLLISDKIETFIKNGNNINGSINDYGCLLNYFILTEQDFVVETLLNYTNDDDENIVNLEILTKSTLGAYYGNNSPLMLAAAIRPNPKIVQLLLERVSTNFQKNNQGIEEHVQEKIKSSCENKEKYEEIEKLFEEHKKKLAEANSMHFFSYPDHKED